MDIDKPIAIVLFALSLYGCGPDARTLADRMRHGETEVVHGPTAPHATHSCVECIRSASVACHYLARPQCPQDASARRLPQCAAPAPLHAR